ncbi:hypothetical protein Sango_0870100 [Sesamum angolense]|uniref:DUF4283 domain-containing protein n=1 Tax=Sesamum angolense TaxID=2727404 RepID=A0AAE1X4B8_9LAMI|nr:hypothetical protein Sango_0870100 [Sesamum angolense]
MQPANSNPPPQAATQATPPSFRSFVDVVSSHTAPSFAPEDLRKSFLANSHTQPFGSKIVVNGKRKLIFSDEETKDLPASLRLHLLANSPMKADVTRLRLRRIWTLHGYPMRVFKWDPTFTPDYESSIVRLWVNFPELPAHLIKKDALFAVASIIGAPLQLDTLTVNQATVTRAPICIEVDLSKPLVEEFDIQIQGASTVQRVEYEHAPTYCHLCKHVGHQAAACYIKGNAPKPSSFRISGLINKSSVHKKISGSENGKSNTEMCANTSLDKESNSNVGHMAVVSVYELSCNDTNIILKHLPDTRASYLDNYNIVNDGKECSCEGEQCKPHSTWPLKLLVTTLRNKLKLNVLTKRISWLRI